MVGVGVAEGGGGAGPPQDYYGEYYPAEPYFVPQEMCPHPQQHPQHTHMCTVHADYGGLPVVTSAAMIPPMLPPVLDEGMRHYLVAHPHPHHPSHHQPPPPPHHQPPHHYGPANGGGASQHFYGPGYPGHFHHVPPHHMQPSPPPPVYQKDERTQRQYSKLKQKLERKQNSRINNNNNNGIEVNSGASTPSLSPRKECNGRAGSSGAASEAGSSVHGDDDDTQAVLDLLSATRIPQVSDITPTSALVQWNSPLPEGVTLPNVELTYDLLLGDRGRYKAIYSGPSLSCRVRDLRPGCEYSVCLQIRAGAQTGGASEAATFRAPAAVPARPSPPRVTQRMRSSLLLRWQLANDCGSRVTHYLLEMDDGSGYTELARPRSRQHTATALRPQTRYCFRIAAVNDIGVSEWSEDCVVWTAGAPPPAPPPPGLKEATSRALTLDWPSVDDAEFTLQMDDAARGHGYLPVYSGTDTAYTCDNLHRATNYRFRLRTETDDGIGPWSEEVTYRTHPERPGPPSRPTARGKVHSRSFRLRWEQPDNDGGAAIDAYTLELDSGEGFHRAYHGPDREAHCERLQPGTPYRARVRCTTCAGDSDWSAAETVTTEPSCPAACRTPDAASDPRPTHATVRWQAPESTGGAPLTEYRVEVLDSGNEPHLAYSGSERECTLRDLTPGRRYDITVTAYNRVGAGPTSAPLTIRTPPAPPAAPTLHSLELRGACVAFLQWLPPNENGAPILHYRLEMSSTNVEESFVEIYRGLETSYLVEKLTPFSTYFFRVSATNSAGRGPWSGVRDALTARAPPAAPHAPRIDASAASLRLQWRAPACHGAELLHYRIELGDHTFDTDGPVCERLVDGLAPDTTYPVRVAAANELGLGEWSERVPATTRPPPPTPPTIRVASVAHNCLRLEWEEASDGAQYCVEMRASEAREFRTVYKGSARSCRVKKLRETSEYQFRIRASDERGGRGGWSDAMSARTGQAPPPAPRTPVLQLVGAKQANAVWDQIEDATYVLQCAKAKDAVYKQVYSGGETQFQLEELEAGGEYLVRVCGVRGGLAGAWSAAARLAVPARVQAAGAAAAGAGRRRRARVLAPREVALLLAGGFVLLGVLVAVLLQRLVDPAP